MSKKNKTITVHTIVKNEDQWIWYALMSVLDFADKILVFDTGSTDKTKEIIQAIKSPKIIFEEKGEVNPSGLTKLRQEQLDMTKNDWIFIVDGDEVWPKEALLEMRQLINNASSDIYGIVSPAWNLIGDVYHFHPESEDYHWPYAPEKIKGWMNLRMMKKNISGFHVKGEYPLEAYCDKKETPIQNYGSKKLLFAKKRYFHMTYLPRSSNPVQTLKRGTRKVPEIGRRLSESVSFPEVFYSKQPNIVSSCWIKQSLEDKIKAGLFTPFKRIKRKIFK